ncbi:MAG: hypothetical protein KAT62_00835 [Desulfuromonadales bacterium]|nr:hypothetical protein [Desulfuromonadales bacterium]
MALTDIKRFRGDTKPLGMKLTHKVEVDGVKVKQIFPLAGCSAKLSVSAEENPTGSVYLLQSTAEVDAVAGTLSFPFTDQGANQVGDSYYDVQLTDGDGKTGTIRKGKMIFSQDITK